MVQKITKPIIGYKVKKPDDAATTSDSANSSDIAIAQTDNANGDIRANSVDSSKDNIIHMHEQLERPEMLVGSTYKIKTPQSEHALYVTINDMILNPGTPFEKRRPFEVFINSKNMDHFQWIVALTRIISAVFRKGGDVTFLVEELHSVFDPRGGYYKRGGRYTPSLVAEIGDAIEAHLREIGLIRDRTLDEGQRRLIEEKKKQLAASQSNNESNDNFPPSAVLCRKCNTRAAVVMDGCLTCLNCGDSKCG